MKETKEYYCLSEEDIVSLLKEGCKWLIVFGSVVFVSAIFVFTVY